MSSGCIELQFASSPTIRQTYFRLYALVYIEFNNIRPGYYRPFAVECRSLCLWPATQRVIHHCHSLCHRSGIRHTQAKPDKAVSHQYDLSFGLHSDTWESGGLRRHRSRVIWSSVRLLCARYDGELPLFNRPQAVRWVLRCVASNIRISSRCTSATDTLNILPKTPNRLHWMIRLYSVLWGP